MIIFTELSQLVKRSLRWQVDELSSKQEECTQHDAIHKAILGDTQADWSV